MDCSVTKWVGNEFSTIELGDKRLNKRFNAVMVGLIKKSEENISSTFESWAEIKSSYRFLNNSSFDENDLLEPHKDKTIARIKKEKIVLLLQDTTYLEYNNRPKMMGLDYVNRNPPIIPRKKEQEIDLG